MDTNAVRFYPAMMRARGLTIPLSLARDQRFYVGWCVFTGHCVLRLWRDDTYPVGAGAVLGFQEYDNELLRRILLGYYASDTLISWLRHKGAARTRHRLPRDVNDDSTPPRCGRRKRGDRREYVEVLNGPAEIPWRARCAQSDMSRF